MNISVQKLLVKIEEELKQAKTVNRQESLRERIYSIKILCELILDENGGTATASRKEAVINQPGPVATRQPVAIPQPKTLDLDDEANGDSLFDF